jgi:hypothetical protein
LTIYRTILFALDEDGKLARNFSNPNKSLNSFHPVGSGATENLSLARAAGCGKMFAGMDEV